MSCRYLFDLKGFQALSAELLLGAKAVDAEFHGVAGA
jgi:hypothetical protein